MNSQIDFELIKKTVMPYFVKVYGEEYIDIIISRMNQIVPIFYTTVDGQKNVMYTKQSAKQVELTIRFLEDNGIKLSDGMKEKLIRNNNTYGLSEIKEAKELLEICFNSLGYRNMRFNDICSIVRNPSNNLVAIEKSVAILNYFGINVNFQKYNEWIVTNEAKKELQRINGIIDYIQQMDLEYEKFNQQFNELNQLITKNKEIEDKIKKQKMIEFLKEIKPILFENDQQQLDQYISNNNVDGFLYDKNIRVLKLLGNSLFSNGLLFAFSTKAKEKLKNTNTSSFIKEDILDNIKKYYQLLGLYHDQMPILEFIQTEEAIKYMPNQEMVDKIMTMKEQYSKDASDEILSLTSSYKSNLEQINGMELANDSSIELSDIKENIVCIKPSFKYVNGKPEMVTVLLFSIESCLPQYIDTNLIHEINHAVELSMLSCTNNHLVEKCGFEIISDSDEDRNYEGFSEVINQLIAIEITNAMHQDGVYLFDNSKTSKTTGGTSYEQQRILVNDFFSEFKRTIMRARVDNKMDYLYNVVGRDNFELLNNIVNEYRTIPFYSMMNDLIEGKTTELTVQRTRLIEESREVLKRMNEHAKLLNSEENDNMTK